METKDDKNDRIEGWLEDSFNRTMSDYGSQVRCTIRSTVGTAEKGHLSPLKFPIVVQSNRVNCSNKISRK